jgi:hypothetical protein
LFSPCAFKHAKVRDGAAPGAAAACMPSKNCFLPVGTRSKFVCVFYVIRANVSSNYSFNAGDSALLVYYTLRSESTTVEDLIGFAVSFTAAAKQVFTKSDDLSVLP